MGKECRKKRLESVYELQGVIGRGQMGIVSRCRHKATGRVFACKTLVKQSMDSAKSRLEAQREVLPTLAFPPPTPGLWSSSGSTRPQCS